MKKKITLIILILSFLSSCGYSRLDKLVNSNYKFSEINIYGDKSIGYLINNELRVLGNKESKNIVYLDLKVNAAKNISEKNEKNEITKYSLEIKADVIIKDSMQKILIKDEFFIKDSYKVENTSIETQDNQKKLKERLSKRISNQINIFISQYYK